MALDAEQQCPIFKTLGVENELTIPQILALGTTTATKLFQGFAFGRKVKLIEAYASRVAAKASTTSKFRIGIYRNATATCCGSVAFVSTVCTAAGKALAGAIVTASAEFGSTDTLMVKMIAKQVDAGDAKLIIRYKKI